MIYVVTKQTNLFISDIYKIINVKESLDFLNTLHIVGFDTETEGLDPWTKKLKSIQLGNYDNQVVIDCTTIDPKLYKEYLESNRLFIGWNLKFDLKFLFRHGIIPRNLWDGYLAEKLMYLGYPSGMHWFSLKAAGENYLGIELDKSVRGKIIYAGLTPDVIEYSANDVKYLEKIMELQKIALKEKELNIAIEYENRFVLPLAYCEYCGIKLDINAWKAKMVKDEQRVKEAIDTCNKWLINNEPNSKYVIVDTQGDLFSGYDLSPKININWNSAKQLIPLFKKYNVEVEIEDKKTGGIKDTINAKKLKPQSNKCSLIPLYIEYREAIKVTSTYGENFLQQINPVSHRIHTNYQQLGAATTRITSGGKDKENKVDYVNLLNIPADEETRSCFIAEPNNKWISIDYSGQETCLMASIANDKAIIDELTNGSGDIHSLVASISYDDIIPKGTDIKKIKKEYHQERQDAKGIEFAINYGGNAYTIYKNKGIPIEKANIIYNKYMAGFTGLKQYQDFRRIDWLKGYILLNEKTGHKAFVWNIDVLNEEKRMFNEPGFWDNYRALKVNNPESNIIHKVKEYFKNKSAWERNSINYPIQGTGSLCLRVSLINFFEYLRNNDLLFKVLITVTPYDEINCEAPEDIANNIAKVLYNCMVKAGAYFCTRCKLDADLSTNEDGSLPNHWVH